MAARTRCIQGPAATSFANHRPELAPLLSGFGVAPVIWDLIYKSQLTVHTQSQRQSSPWCQCSWASAAAVSKPSWASGLPGNLTSQAWIRQGQKPGPEETYCYNLLQLWPDLHVPTGASWLCLLFPSGGFVLLVETLDSSRSKGSLRKVLPVCQLHRGSGLKLDPDGLPTSEVRILALHGAGTRVQPCWSLWRADAKRYCSQQRIKTLKCLNATNEATNQQCMPHC